VLDARVVAANMYQRNALTLKELQSIQSQRDRPIEAAETLLNIILEQPDAVYLTFLDVLKNTHQQHIHQKLVEGGYRGLWFSAILANKYCCCCGFRFTLRLRNDLYCVGWGVKLYSLTHFRFTRDIS